MAMLILLKTQLHDLAMSVSDHTVSPNGGGPRIDRWSALAGKFWVLDITPQTAKICTSATVAKVGRIS